MAVSRERVLQELAQIAVPGGGNLVSDDLVRALHVDSGTIRFVIEAADGSKSYWALAHGASQPDFHLRQSFALTLHRTTT